MAESITTNGIDAYAQFEKWLDEQPYWLQDAAYRIYHGQPIDEDQIADYAMMCVVQSKKGTPDYKKLPHNGTKIQAVSERMSAIRIYDIIGVNALAPDANLEFSETGVTVVYGLNGAGKSGFMRIFKQLSGSPYEEAIQPNVFKSGSGAKPSCKFVIKEDENEREIACSLSVKTKNTPLVNCDVFDTRISNEYITRTNNVSYQPFVFTVLTELSSIADRVSKYIANQIAVIPSTDISVPEEFSNRDDISWLNRLDSNSVFPVDFTAWTEEQQNQLQELLRRLDTEKVQASLRLNKTHLDAVKPILEDLTAASNAVVMENLKEVYELYLKSKSRLSAAETLFTEKADELDQLSVSSADWKELWLIAQRYYETSIRKSDECAHFGEEGSVCPLCHQIIPEEAALRFATVNEYVNGTCSEDYSNATANLKKMLLKAKKRAYTSEQIELLLSKIFVPAEIEIIKAVYSKLSICSLDTPDLEASYAQIVKLNFEQAIELLSKKSDLLAANVSTLEKALEDEGRAELSKKCQDLQYHKWLSDNRSLIETAIANIRQAQELKNAKAYTTTNKITTESNLLADTLITEAYIERFNAELKTLAKKLKVKLEKAPSQKGSTPYKVSIDTDTGIRCKPEDILSEGEQRIVALAAFFADATGRSAKTPLIIDDPISSLDYNYEDTATSRIVELAKDRQVIVFTHRISLLVGIKDECEAEGVPCFENRIRSAVKGKGVPDFEGNYYGKIPQQLNELLNRIAQIKKKDPDSEEYVDAIGRTCQQFRICVERTVEDELLFGVVKRFRRKITTQNLVTKLPAISKPDCEMIDGMMTKYSYMEHSQPAETPSEYYDIEEIQEDIQTFKSWLDEFKSRTKSL